MGSRALFFEIEKNQHRLRQLGLYQQQGCPEFVFGAPQEQGSPRFEPAPKQHLYNDSQDLVFVKD